MDGPTVGTPLGLPVGTPLGLDVGDPDGGCENVGTAEGSLVGTVVGVYEGALDGVPDGPDVGAGDGVSLGADVGGTVGPPVGADVGTLVGLGIGSGVGRLVGTFVGRSVGSGTGTFVGSCAFAAASSSSTVFQRGEPIIVVSGVVARRRADSTGRGAQSLAGSLEPPSRTALKLACSATRAAKLLPSGQSCTQATVRLSSGTRASSTASNMANPARLSAGVSLLRPFRHSCAWTSVLFFTGSYARRSRSRAIPLETKTRTIKPAPQIYGLERSRV